MTKKPTLRLMKACIKCGKYFMEPSAVSTRYRTNQCPRKCEGAMNLIYKEFPENKDYKLRLESDFKKKYDENGDEKSVADLIMGKNQHEEWQFREKEYAKGEYKEGDDSKYIVEHLRHQISDIKEDRQFNYHVIREIGSKYLSVFLSEKTKSFQTCFYNFMNCQSSGSISKIMKITRQAVEKKFNRIIQKSIKKRCKEIGVEYMEVSAKKFKKILGLCLT